MIGRLLSLILLSTLSLSGMNEVPQQISSIVANIGDNVTLTCTVSNPDAGLRYWYKMNFGYMFETVAIETYATLSVKEQFDKSRFIATKQGRVHSLTIRNVNKEDEAAYFCQAGSAYMMEFINATVLAVNDPKTQQKNVTVIQTPDVESVHLGDTVTLQCSLLSENRNDTVQCPGDDKVHWFKGASESHPGIIYHGSIRKREEGRCDYSLSKTMTNSSDAGTYHCAVVTCGEILFGEGTKVEISFGSPVVTVLVTLLTCSVLVNAALIFARKRKPECERSRADATVTNQSPINQQERSATDQLNNAQGDDVGVNYVALDFPSRKAKRWKNKKEVPDECMHYGTTVPVQHAA